MLRRWKLVITEIKRTNFMKSVTCVYVTMSLNETADSSLTAVGTTDSRNVNTVTCPLMRGHDSSVKMTEASEALEFIPKEEVKQGKYRSHGRPKSKKGRIIVRNLPFKDLSEDKLKKWFSEYGEIEEVKLLRKDDRKFVGCGFVQFVKVSSAEKAVKQANEKLMSGRKIIVDWAVPKDVYASSLKYLKQEIKREPEDDGSESGEILPYWEDTKPDQQLEEKNQTNEDSDSEDNESEDGEIEDVKYNISEKENLEMNKKKTPAKSNDVEEGKTVFVRNLPFSVTDDDLRKCFSQFGALEYALVCVDRLTEHSKGTGFVKFKDKSSAEVCIQQNNKITIEDNPLSLSLAVSKDDLENQKKKKTAKDSRNLYLAKEGVIIAGSVAARGVSASDMAKRLEIEHWKSQMLKNLNMFISDRRLIVHNLPPTYDDPQLKALFIKHTHPKACITEARVMRDKKKIDGKTGLGVSKEYGFVAFSTREDALLALRNINNNPKIFSIKKRPIVAFSIESKVALNLKKKRLEKSRIKLGIDNDGSKLMKLNRKQRRFIKRREKLIQRRRESKKLKNEGPNADENVKENVRKRRLADSENGTISSKKQKISKGVQDREEETSDYCGIVSEPGTKVRLQSRFKLKNQARIHKQKLKEEKSARRKKSKKVKTESVKQPKQKQGKKKRVGDGSQLNKLIKKRAKAFETSASFKKWDEK